MVEARAHFRPGQPVRIDTNGFAYATKFKYWERRAAVRAKPRRVLEEEYESKKVFFPPELVPVVSHPLLAARGSAVLRQILLARLHLYLDFTAELEQMAVNPVTQQISRRRSGFDVPESMVEDAYKICTDESWHAQFSDDLQRQLVSLTGVRPALPAEPQFFTRLRELEADAEPEAKGLPILFFTIVSETLISAILSDIPSDGRVLTTVRELVADHAEDEGRHHAFFTQFFKLVWPQLSRRQRRLAGAFLPQLVLAFLEPDYAALAAILRSSGLSAEEIRGVIEESHPRAEVRTGIREAAGATLRLFREQGVLDDPAAHAAFVSADLVEA